MCVPVCVCVYYDISLTFFVKFVDIFGVMLQKEKKDF
jgi:hypothetical protein